LFAGEPGKLFMEFRVWITSLIGIVRQT